MFVLGLQFKYTFFKQFGLTAFAVAGIASIAAFVTGIAMGLAFGWSHMHSLLLGALLIPTSTTIALRIRDELGMIKGSDSKVIMGAIVIDDLYGFVALALVTTQISIMNIFDADIAFAFFGMILTIAAIFIVGVKVAPRIFGATENHFPGSALTLGTAFCLLLSYVVVSFNISPLIGAFLAGTILTSTFAYRDVLKSIIPIRNLFASVFFVSIGLLIDPSLLLPILPLALLVSLLAIVSKGLASALVLWKMGTGRGRALMLGALTGPRGEVTLVIAQTVVLGGLIGPSFLAIATSLVLLTAFMTPIFIRLAGSVKSS